jgi:predicted transcriptional regulator with HTH domain
MRVVILDGTPEEIAQALPQLSGVSVLTTAQVTAPPPGSATASVGQRYVDTEVARRVLTRRTLSEEQRRVLAAMYEAYPGTVLASSLQELIGYTPSQFAGLMGAFGRRFTHTEGFEAGSWFFEQQWDYDEGCFRYALPTSVREALEIENLV